jgi:5-methylcytosine-specific restriction endonuclease McrA
MISIEQLNDPEYRWYHKEEMAKIMPFTSERNRLGITVINYDQLRRQHLSTIKETKSHNLDWDRFRCLIDSIPARAYYETSKTKLQPKDFYHFEKRDGCECYICGTVSRFTQLHHVIPTGPVTDDNVVTLCEPCHKMVHIALYVSGKRRGFRI